VTRSIVERSMDDRWLSSAFVVGDEPGGVAVFVDSGAPLEPLLELVERERLTPTHVLHPRAPRPRRARGRARRRFRVPVVTDGVETGGLRIEAIPTPGHSDDGVAFVVNGEACFSGDTLFRDAVGGGPADVVRMSVMERLMTLPHEMRVLPGHTVETTIGREWERNPFVRFWRGLDPEDGGRCRVGGEEGTVLVTSPDYDGKGKLLVRLDDGTERIIGASRVELL
jgi:glyoxylase-like metal-dependent hydrolase (beta-lactamase superfamily II)